MKIVKGSPELVQELADLLFEKPDLKVLVVGGTKRELGQYNHKQFIKWDDSRSIREDSKPPASVHVAIMLRVAGAAHRVITDNLPENAQVLEYESQNSFYDFVGRLHSSLSVRQRQAKIIRKEERRQAFEAQAQPTQEAAASAGVAMSANMESSPEENVVSNNNSSAARQKQKFKGRGLHGFLNRKFEKKHLMEENMEVLVLEVESKLEETEYGYSHEELQASIETWRRSQEKHEAPAAKALPPLPATAAEPVHAQTSEDPLELVIRFLESLMQADDPRLLGLKELMAKAKTIGELEGRIQELESQIQEQEPYKRFHKTLLKLAQEIA